VAWSPEFPVWVFYLAASLTALGSVIGVWRSSKYELQIKFQHCDGTDRQWIAVAKSKNDADLHTFEKQASLVKQQFV